MSAVAVEAAAAAAAPQSGFYCHSYYIYACTTADVAALLYQSIVPWTIETCFFNIETKEWLKTCNAKFVNTVPGAT